MTTVACERQALTPQFLSSEAVTTLVTRLQNLINNYAYVENGHVHVQDYLSFPEYCWRLLARHTGHATDERIKTYTVFRKLEHVSWLIIVQNGGDPPITEVEVAEVFLRSNKRLRTGLASS